MGHRNPYRISVDKHTGFLYWGDVGPDAPADSANRGPAGHDEVNQARKPGYFGWPYFVGDNKAYFDYDFATNTPGKQFDPAHPVNDSPNNTGLTELPPAQKAFIWYPAAKSDVFPLVGSGGRTAMAGPVFHRDDFKNAARAFPAYYDGKFLAYEWMRGWIMAVTMNAKGDLVSMERFMPSQKFSNPIELEFSPTGDLYMLEYGTGWFQGNPDARLVRIEYNGGNREAGRRRRGGQGGGSDAARGRAVVAGDDRSRRRRAALSVDDHAVRRAPWCARSPSPIRRSPSRSLACTPRRSPSPTRRARAVDGERADRRRQRAAAGRHRRRRWQPDVLLPGHADQVRDARDGS